MNHTETAGAISRVQGRTDSKERLRLWLKLLKASRFLEAEVREKFRTEFEFTLPRFDVLAALDRAGRDLRMSELSDALKVSNGNITGIVDRLVADGQLRRVSVAGDRRATGVRLTQKGRDMFDRTATAHEEWINGLLSRVSRGDAERMILLLSPIVDRPAAVEQKGCIA